jgi:glyoxylase-like metal-dependent hydrolase (beta-lactamase superfamily II)
MPQTPKRDPSKALKKHKSLQELVAGSKLKFVNMEIKTFHFNQLMVNTYILSDETGEAVIVDPGNIQSYEDAQIRDYIAAKNLKIKYIINTHPHIDHIAGNSWCKKEFGVEVLIHENSLPLYDRALSYAAIFGLELEEMPAPDRFLKEGDVVAFGNQKLSVVYTPGHCEGSVCLYDADDKIIITGDLIFEMSVGRSDLPTGNEVLLQQSIREKVLTLPDDVTILPGHGDPTTIGRERTRNPYIIH